MTQTKRKRVPGLQRERVYKNSNFLPNNDLTITTDLLHAV